MIFIKFLWTLLVLFSLGVASENIDAEQQPRDGSDSDNFIQMPGEKSKLKTEKENWTWLEKADEDTCRADENIGYTQEQVEEFDCEEDEEAFDQDYTSMKCPAFLDEPEDDYESRKMDLSDRFHQVLSGRLPEEITDIVFELIHNDTDFEQMLSVLERNLENRLTQWIQANNYTNKINLRRNLFLEDHMAETEYNDES